MISGRDILEMIFVLLVAAYLAVLMSDVARDTLLPDFDDTGISEGHPSRGR